MVLDRAYVAPHQTQADGWAPDKSSVRYSNKLRYKSLAPQNSKRLFFLRNSTLGTKYLSQFVFKMSLKPQPEAAASSAVVAVVTSFTYFSVFSL